MIRTMKYFKFLFNVLISGALVSSCTDIETDLSDQLSENVTTEDPEAEEEMVGSGATVASAYNTLLSGTAGHNNYFSVQEVSSDEVAIPAKGGDWFDGGIWVDMHRHEWTTTSGPLNNTYNTQYAGIGECNRYLANSTDPEGVAQVRALRAYYYYRLLDLFGRVKIVTSVDNPATEDENEADAKQSERAEVFKFVEDELKAVIESGNLPTTRIGIEGADRFNEAGANALLAKLYLNAEVYTGTAQWQDASNAADEVINSGLYMLTEDYGEVFSPMNSGDPEHILVAPYDQPSGKNGMNFAHMTLHYGSQATYNLADQPWNGYTTLKEFYDSYSSEDKRRQNNFLVGLQRDADGNPLVDLAAEGAEDPDGFELNFTPEINELFPNAIRQGGARLSKFGFEDGAQSDMNNDYPILRYGDILLVKAEAEARMAGNWSAPEALRLVNQLRARAGVSAYTSLTEDEFLAERGREMFMEASRRQDYIRFGRWGNEWWEKPKSAEFRELFPIPQEQIMASQSSKFKLTQNPGY